MLKNTRVYGRACFTGDGTLPAESTHRKAGQSESAPTREVEAPIAGVSLPAMLLLLLCLLVPGCISTYAPAVPVTPLLDEAGDIAIGGSVRVAGPKAGASVYAAAAPSELSLIHI